MPVVVTRFDPASRTVQAVSNLGVNDLTVQLGTASVLVRDVSVDAGPKRVILVLDASQRIPNDEWKLEVEMAATLVTKARTADTLALLLIGSGGTESALSPATEIGERLRILSGARPSSSEPNERTVDALIQAANLLIPPSFGDSIFLFGHDEDSGSRAGQEQLREILLKHRLRFYGMSFTNPLEGKLPAGFDLNKPLPASLGPSKLAQLSMATGYNFSFFSVSALSIPGQLRLLKEHIGDLYAGIAAPYRIVIPADSIPAPGSVRLTVTNAQERNINLRDVHYPKFIYPCGTDSVH